MKYKIGFNHTSGKGANSKAAALAIVKTEATQKRFGAATRLRHINCDDGEYIYLNTDDMRRDPDGSRAFAIITKI